MIGPSDLFLSGDPRIMPSADDSGPITAIRALRSTHTSTKFFHSGHNWQLSKSVIRLATTVTSIARYIRGLVHDIPTVVDRPAPRFQIKNNSMYTSARAYWEGIMRLTSMCLKLAPDAGSADH